MFHVKRQGIQKLEAQGLVRRGDDSACKSHDLAMKMRGFVWFWEDNHWGIRKVSCSVTETRSLAKARSCELDVVDKFAADHRDPSQWEFIVVPTAVLPETSKTITLRSLLRKCSSERVEIRELPSRIERALAGE